MAITWATVEGNIATFDALIAHGADVNHAEEVEILAEILYSHNY